MYHHTKGFFLDGILQDGVIDTTPRFRLSGKTQEELERELTPTRGFYQFVVSLDEYSVCPLIWERGERPAVWLTGETRPIGCIGGDCQDNRRRYEGVFRIGIDTSKVVVYPWVEVEKRTRISKKWRQRLAEDARAAGDDPTKWHFSLYPIPRAAWTVIERWEQTHWVDVCPAHPVTGVLQ